VGGDTPLPYEQHALTWTVLGHALALTAER